MALPGANCPANILFINTPTPSINANKIPPKANKYYIVIFDKTKQTLKL